MWRENCQVDLDYHVRPWTLPAPGGRRKLDDAIGEIVGTPLDRSRPLWEMYFVEGLANGRIAVVNKIHHARADAVPAANLLELRMDLTTESQTVREFYDSDPAPTRGQLARKAFRDHLRYDGQADHPLLASVPVSFDFSPQRISGNYFTGVLMPIPVQAQTPLDRVREAHNAAMTAKESNQLIGPEVVSRWSNSCHRPEWKRCSSGCPTATGRTRCSS